MKLIPARSLCPTTVSPNSGPSDGTKLQTPGRGGDLKTIVVEQKLNQTFVGVNFTHEKYLKLLF